LLILASGKAMLILKEAKMVKGNKWIPVTMILVLILLVGMFACAYKETRPSGPSGAKEPTTPPVPPGLQTVPVVPNDSVVTGTVNAVRSTTGRFPWEIDIKVQTSQDVPGYRNLTKQKIGEVISVRTKENVAQLQVGQVITARVKVVGDEKGIFYYGWDIS